MSQYFSAIRVPIVDNSFLDCFKRNIGTHTHVAYRVFVKNGEKRLTIKRLIGEDCLGVLTIGFGNTKRIHELVKSIKTGAGHHFGLKYRQLPSDSILAEDLFFEMCGFGSSAEAKCCEGIAQAAYRRKHGENPPFSGRWEGDNSTAT